MSIGQRNTRAPRRILIASFDLFRNVGGGQSVYKALIAARPRDQFYYFRRWEKPDAARPPNAVGIPYKAEFLGTPDKLPPGLGHFFHVYLECRNMAASVAKHSPGIELDVIDVPDFSQAGLFLAQTLAAEGIGTGMTALALHGTLSSAFRGGWPAPGDHKRLLAELRMRERLQFRVADARYAISDVYADQWRRIIPLPVNRLDPLCIVDIPTPVRSVPSDEPPDLAFVGRREKWKGPDLFLDLAWCLDPALYRRLIVAGPEGPNHCEIGSMAFLPGVAGLRGLHPEIVGGLPPDDLRKLCEGRTVLLLPSRHDTFNLVALEAILRGTPVHVSRHAGVAAWLRTRLPSLPWLVIDIDCARTAAATVAETLLDYDRRRDELVDALTRDPPHADFSTVDAIHVPADVTDLRARQSMNEMAARFATQVRLSSGSDGALLVLRELGSGRRIRGLVASALPAQIRGMIRGMRQLNAMRHGERPHWAAIETMKRHVKAVTGLSTRTLGQINATRRFDLNRRNLLGSNEVRVPDVRTRLRELSRRVPDGLINRVPLFLEMARLERRAGNDLTAATYNLRIMRWLGRDAYGDLPFVAATLRAHQLPHEADAAEAMFGPRERSVRRCFELVQAAYHRNRRKPELPLAMLDDRRGQRRRRVAVIVSLYKAADKLPTLLRMLAQQTVALRGEMEVVLIDSNSPADEHGAMRRTLAEHPLPVVYARSEERETIQAAWNRGIHLARAPYLSFLGADEGLHPDALRQLADTLDANPSVDWAMADSVVTNVDRHGVYSGDVMPYDRRGYTQDLVYLETCYLSWVGGLYRRSIHERFGYYDESFRASGDTEFKNRVLPHIRSLHVPKMLGVFNNYPEERTTASPRAEIEDLRAWYLWRTRGGLHYAFDQRPADDAAALMRTALNYRKSYCGHLSSDFDFADALADYLNGRPDAPPWVAQTRKEMAKTLELMRSIELPPLHIPHGPYGVRSMLWAWRKIREVKALGHRHQKMMDLPTRPTYEVFNDNRHEQHWWSWSA